MPRDRNQNAASGLRARLTARGAKPHSRMSDLSRYMLDHADELQALLADGFAWADIADLLAQEEKLRDKRGQPITPSLAKLTWSRTRKRQQPASVGRQGAAIGAGRENIGAVAGAAISEARLAPDLRGTSPPQPPAPPAEQVVASSWTGGAKNPWPFASQTDPQHGNFGPIAGDTTGEALMVSDAGGTHQPQPPAVPADSLFARPADPPPDIPTARLRDCTPVPVTAKTPATSAPSKLTDEQVAERIADLAERQARPEIPLAKLL